MKDGRARLINGPQSGDRDRSNAEGSRIDDAARLFGPTRTVGTQTRNAGGEAGGGRKGTDGKSIPQVWT